MRTCSTCGHANSPDSSLCTRCGTELATEPSEPAGDIIDELIALVESNQKIAAIKLFREQTGAGLKEAKEAVEAIEQGKTASLLLPTAEDTQQKILAFLMQDRKIPAIKLYREQTGVGLCEAKAAVEALSVEHDITSTRTGCSITTAIVIVAALLGFGLLA